MESGVHATLHQKCHNLIIYAQLSLKCHYPPFFKQDILHYKYANTDLIKRAFNYYPWERSMTEKYVNKNSYIFLKTIKNIF